VAWLAVAAACVCVADGVSERSVSRIADVRKWDAAARKKASSAAKTFLEESERVRPAGFRAFEDLNIAIAALLGGPGALQRSCERVQLQRAAAPAARGPAARTPAHPPAARRGGPLRPPPCAPAAPQTLMVPVGVEVFLIGFDGRGGYAFKQDTKALLSLLNSGIPHHCPHSLETKEELGVCFQINYSVLGPEELGEEVRGGRPAGRQGAAPGRQRASSGGRGRAATRPISGCIRGRPWMRRNGRGAHAFAGRGEQRTRSRLPPPSLPSRQQPAPPLSPAPPGPPPAARHRVPHAHQP
jgi:hypothetical protein